MEHLIKDLISIDQGIFDMYLFKNLFLYFLLVTYVSTHLRFIEAIVKYS